MVSKTCWILCIQIYLIKSISAYCANAAWSANLPAEDFGWAAPGFAYEAPLIAPVPCTTAAPFLGAYDLAAFPSSYGGGFSVSSVSPIPPYGVTVISENDIEGILAVGGQLPFLGTVGLEGALPTTGAGVISYGCRNGNVGMVGEHMSPITVGSVWSASGLGYGPAVVDGLNYGTGWAGPAIGYGCGCGTIY